MRFEHTDKAGREPKKRNSAVVVTKTLDCTQAEDKITSLKIHCEGRPSALGVSYSSETFLQEIWEEYRAKVLTGSRSRTFCERAREERYNFVNYTTRWTTQSKSECTAVQATR